MDFFDLFCSYRVSVFTGFSSRSVYSFYRVFTEFPPKFVPSRSGSVGFSSEKKKQKKETSLDVTELLFFFSLSEYFFFTEFRRRVATEAVGSRARAKWFIDRRSILVNEATITRVSAFFKRTKRYANHSFRFVSVIMFFFCPSISWDSIAVADGHLVVVVVLFLFFF